MKRIALIAAAAAVLAAPAAFAQASAVFELRAANPLLRARDLFGDEPKPVHGLLHVVGTLDAPAAGRILFEGRDILDARTGVGAARRTQQTPQPEPDVVQRAADKTLADALPFQFLGHLGLDRTRDGRFRGIGPGRKAGSGNRPAAGSRVARREEAGLVALGQPLQEGAALGRLLGADAARGHRRGAYT